MRQLRFKLAGVFLAASLFVMPRSRVRTLLAAAIEDWMSEAASEIYGERRRVELRDCLK